MDKLQILQELNQLGFGYCTPEACEENIMGLPDYTWEDVLNTDIEDLQELLDWGINE